jgi:hypothetical protein
MIFQNCEGYMRQKPGFCGAILLDGLFGINNSVIVIEYFRIFKKLFLVGSLIRGGGMKKEQFL